MRMGAGGTPLLSYVFFPSSEKWLTPGIARIGRFVNESAWEGAGEARRATTFPLTLSM